LDPTVELRAFDVDVGDFGCGEDVGHAGDGFADEHDEEGEDEGAVDGEFEGVDPEEGDYWCGVDVFAGPVAGCAGDGAADCEAEDDGGGFHEGGAELFDDDYGDEDAEAEADEFGVAPAKEQN